MKKTYTKKQIQEAINYWQKQLKIMNESKDINSMVEEWYSKLRTNPQIVTVIQKNGKTIQFEATLKDVPQDEYDSMYGERQYKLWFVQPEFDEKRFINLQKYDIADISFKQVPYRVLVSNNTRRVPKVIKTTLNLQAAIDELLRYAATDSARGRSHGRSDDKLDVNGENSRYNGYDCSVWIDQTTERPSTKY